MHANNRTNEERLYQDRNIQIGNYGLNETDRYMLPNQRQQYRNSLNRSPSENMDSPNLSNKCCDGCRNVLAAIFCCRTQSTSRRIGVFLLWISLVFLAFGLCVGLIVYGRRHMTPTAGDSIWAKDGLDSYCCQGATIEATNVTNIYLLPHHPEISNDKKQEQYFKTTISLPLDSFEFYGFHLLEGSVVTISACADNSYGARIYILKGVNNLRRWKNDRFCTECSLEVQWIGSCRHDDQKSSDINFYVTSADFYYFSFLNEYSSETHVKVAFNVSKTFYVTKFHTFECQNATYCYLPFTKIGGQESVVLSVPEAKGLFNMTLTITTACDARIWVYIVHFLAPTLLIGFLGSLIIYCCGRTRRQTGRILATADVSEQQHIVPSQTVYGSNSYTHGVLQMPPPYASIIKPNETPPPGYEEVTRNNSMT